ncbi:U3 small nucleolar RNA-associated protein 13, putative (UTP13) [Plasmodium ovale wallikeri]|uniref:U3 small nucleolar RNA-associated protein 13, putative (UTP13) n=1 Tax=Plasmodium ovale wallikeri TaxID=864142 RepID=A0A1A8YRT3_PLAOA|nr:U3 small nucleolar RNA-associated protein 13, putative (UTP13) [Plasmodium ovale wallikeri]
MSGMEGMVGTSLTSGTEIEKKFFDFYEGNENVFYTEECDLFLSLCDHNIYCFKVNPRKGSQYDNVYSAMYPTCILESCTEIDDIKEFYHKRYLNRHCVSLFNSIRHFYYAHRNLFLSTDDHSIHHYVLTLNYDIYGNLENGKNGKNEKEEEMNVPNEEQNIYLYDCEEDEGKNAYSYSYNWVYLRKGKMWKSDNISISCFHYNEVEYKKLIVGYINGLVNVYNIDTYKLKVSYKIHNSRITNLKMYKNFIISSDVTKHIFIYDVTKMEKVISCDDHMSGIVDFLFLAIPGKKDDQEEDRCKDDKLIGFISIGNDKIMNVWDLSLLNAPSEQDSDGLKGEQIGNKEESKDGSKDGNKEGSKDGNKEGSKDGSKGKKKEERKKERKKRNNDVISCSPIKQIYLTSDVNSALIVPSNLFKSEKSKLIIKDENIKWLIVTHDISGNILFYNPIKGDILYKFKENRAFINESNVKKLILLKWKLHIFREDSSILIYDIRNFKLIKNYICKMEGIFEMIFFNPASSDMENQSCNLSNDENIVIDSINSNSTKESNCVVLIGDEIIRVLKFEENLISQELLIGHEDVVCCIKVNEQHLLLFSGSNDKNIFVWNLRNYHCLYVLKDNLYTINAIDVNLKKYPTVILVSVCEDSSLKLWNFAVNSDKLNKKKKKRKLDENFDDKEIVQSSLTIYPHQVLINDVALSPNAKVVATCSKDKTVKLFERKSLKLIRTLEGHKKAVQNIFFSRTDNLLYSNSYDSIRVWDLSNYECIKSIQSLDFNITKMLILSDSCLVNGYSNGNIGIINIKNCEKISTINYHKDKIFCLQRCNNGDKLVSASLNGEIIFLKNVNEKKGTENILEKKKYIYYENCLENLLKEKKINESLLICLKLNKKFKFKTIIENYINYYTFSILHILNKFEYEYDIKKIIQRNTDYNTNAGIIKTEQDYYNGYDNINNSYHENENKINLNGKGFANIHNDNGVNCSNTPSTEVKMKSIYDDDTMIGNIKNYLENEDVLENYIYTELYKLEFTNINKLDNHVKCEKGSTQGGENNSLMIKCENKERDKSNAHLSNTQLQNRSDNDNFEDYIIQHDDNFVLFLKKIKTESEHSYFLYLNKLMEFITFFVVNHRFAYISNFLLNSVIKYIDYADICKINNYQNFFDIYNSYVPRHRNRYLKSLQKSKCFELINISYYKGDVKMMG